MKNNKMKQLIILIIGSILLLSCGMKEEKPKSNINVDAKNLNINDSMLIGCPKISDVKFIKNIQDGGFEYFDKYEQILQNENRRYLTFQKKEIIDEFKINGIVLKLIKKSLQKNNIHIDLYVYKNNIKVSSIVFYKYIYDNNIQDDQQRFECLSYINEELYLWHLETYTNHSENALGIDIWEKYKINSNTGKITLVEKLNP